MRRYMTAISIALSVAAMPTIGSAVEIGVPQQLQQIQQQLQEIQAALTGQGSSSLTQRLQAVQAALVGQTQQLQTLQTAVGGVAKVRKFYLTQENTFDGSEAPSACSAGYHMASLWEIFDPSNLVYDTALGHTSGDGSGPPEFNIGWIRTGGGSGVGQNDTPGERNCAAYTTNDPDSKGTVAALRTNWSSGAGVISPWGASTRACDQPVFVWCVQN
jgi:hypothetical protein